VSRLIVTDLDGTLIDHDTYSAEPARPALDAAARDGVPVVPCSSKTRAEMHRLVADLRLPPVPLVAENGSLVWLPPRWPVMPDDAVAAPGTPGGLVILGTPSEQLRPRLAALGAAVGLRLRPLSAMAVDEIVARTGLAHEGAALAQAREFSEPFVCEPDDVPLEVLQAAARDLGVRVTRGGRFFHLLGQTDKGRAVGVLRAVSGRATRLLGIGDAPNDLSLLAACDDAAIVPQPGRGIHPDLAGALPDARRAPLPGPAGWNIVVLDWLHDTAGS
jgi:mannosyl-3-phosphoglycerate phosphatase